MLDLVSGLHADDLVLCLISGGGSALLPLAAPGLVAATYDGDANFSTSTSAGVAHQVNSGGSTPTTAPTKRSSAAS